MSHYDGFDFGALCFVSLGVRSGRQWYVDCVIHASYGSSPVGFLWFILRAYKPPIYIYIPRMHPAKLRWNPKWRALFSWVICRFHVYFPGCSYYRIWCELSNHGRKDMILWDMIRDDIFYDRFMRIPFLTNHHRMADVFFGRSWFLFWDNHSPNLQPLQANKECCIFQSHWFTGNSRI